MDLMKPSQVAGLLGMTPSGVYKMIAEKRLPFVRTGRSIRIPRAAYDAWLAGKSAEALASVAPAAGKETAHAA